VKALVLFLAAAGLAVAQIGLPGGGYPGQYPYPGGGGRIPGTGPGIPTPGGRGRQQTPRGTGTTTNPNQPLPNFRGKLKHMDAKSLSLEMDDYRVLEFRINGKTKYFKGGQELKSAPDFKEGDLLSVEGPEDATGSLVAVNVYWEKAAAAATTENKDGTVDAWKDKPGEQATGRAPAPAAPDADDPGPPKLKRGIPEQRAAAPPPPQAPSRPAPEPKPPAAQPKQVAENLPPNPVALPPNTVALPPSTVTAPPRAAQPQPPAPNPEPNGVNLPARTVSLPRPEPVDSAVNLPPEPPDDQAPLGSHQEDPLIRKASEAALSFTETLPNYVVQEVVSRYESEAKPANWHAVDVVSTDLVYENGKEDYRNITVNGKPSTKKLEETGAWSTGEFGSVLIDIFSPATAAEFHPRGEARIGAFTAKVYDFDVKRENSHWSLHFGSQTYEPAYHGSTWIDPKTGRVLRIEMQARSLPQQFPTDHVESATEYQYVRLGGTEQFLLPVHAEILSCQRGTSVCARNSIDFRNYHKYAGESNVQFGDVKDDGTAGATPAPKAPAAPQPQSRPRK